MNSCAAIKLMKSGTKESDYISKNFALLEMQMHVNDGAFRQQLGNAKPETREFINRLISDLNNNPDEIKFDWKQYEGSNVTSTSPRRRRSQIVKLGGKHFNLDEHALLRKMKEASKKWVNMQMIINRKTPAYRQSTFNLSQVFSKIQKRKKEKKVAQDFPSLAKTRRGNARRRRRRADDERSQDSGDAGSPREYVPVKLIDFGPAVQKLRKLVECKLLSKTLIDLEQSTLQNVNTIVILNLSNFKAALR